MNSDTNKTTNYTPWYIAGGVVVLIIILVIVFGGKKSADTGIPSLEDRQAQLENDPKLAANVNSVRNNFDPGSYSINKSASSIKWQYGEASGVIPVDGGKLTVIEKGRIGEFSISGDASDSTVDKGDNSKIKNFISKNGKDIAMNALTILPNTNDDAFTVAFTLDALGKKSSLATGMFVEKLEKGIKVSGDIYIDAKTVINPAGFADAKESLKLSVVYVFE